MILTAAVTASWARISPEPFVRVWTFAYARPLWIAAHDRRTDGRRTAGGALARSAERDGNGAGLTARPGVDVGRDRRARQAAERERPGDSPAVLGPTGRLAVRIVETSGRMGRPTLSIVIPAYRSERTIEASLRSFTAQGYRAEIVVVDSSPDERTAEVVRRVAGVRLIRSGARLLPHGARNAGARASAGELLLFTDPDIYPGEGAVEALVQAWKRHGGAVVATLACHGSAWLDRGVHLSKFDLWLAGSAERSVDLGPTSGLLCPRRAFEQVGGFREDLMLGDTVFSWALREAGVPMRLEPRAVFRHHHVQRWPDFVRERFARGREFAGLRRANGSSVQKVYDLASTLTLVRPARVVWRAAANARRAGLGRDAVLTSPVVAGGTLAWFAGEVAGTLGSPEGRKR